jgi:long-chain acyl-CoA synthetase
MIFEHLTSVAETAPTSSGLRQGDGFQSYEALTGRVARLAAGLMERGIGPGSVVALLVPNSPDIFVAAHALFAIGAIAMPLGSTATRPELAAAGTKAGVSAVIAAPALKTAAELLIADAAPNAQLFLTSDLVAMERAETRLPKLAAES